MRRCRCGCGRSLEGRPITQKWHVNITCQRARQAAMRSKMNDERKNVYNSRPGTTKVPQRAHHEPLREPIIVCKSCYGIPDARSPYRRDHSGKPIGVRVNGRWRCRQCNEPHQDPPPIHAQGIVRSSGGTCRDHGRLYGFDWHDRMMDCTPVRKT